MTDSAPITEADRPLRLFFSVGDVSGDLHAANLIREIRRLRPDAVLEGLGGEKMQAAGCTIRYPLTAMNVMWIKNVLRHIRTVLRTQRETLAHFAGHRPDAVVLVDFPGYNLGLARRLWKHRIPVIYYIAPQIWAWHARRIHRIRKHVTRMLCILPFEEKIYRDAGVPVEFVGHPLFDHLDEVTLDETFCRTLRAQTTDRLVGLLPGSRDQEIRALLPVMARAAGRILDTLPGTLFVVSCADERRERIVREVLAKHPHLPVRVFRHRTFEVMKEADFCMVASGTATLELAHYNTPMTILYRVNPVARLLARVFMRTKYIGLVNILCGREVVPERLMWRDEWRGVAADAMEVLTNPERRAAIQQALRELRERLDHPGASRQAAESIIRTAETLRGRVDRTHPEPQTRPVNPSQETAT